MIKILQKPFNIKEWQNGAKIKTRDGRPVRILCTDAKLAKGCIVGLIDYLHNESLTRWYDNGHILNFGEDGRDLVIIEEIEVPWADDKDVRGSGWMLDLHSDICKLPDCSINRKDNFATFATEKLAESARAMARIFQLIANDERYGGCITDAEWDIDQRKYCILKHRNKITKETTLGWGVLLAFHTEKQRDLFLAENEQLVKDYLMVE